MESVPVHETETIQTRLVLPPDTNHLETIFGGKVLAYIDEIAAIASMKHARNTVVTASIDSVDFLSSAKVGDMLTLEAYITSTGRTSMEVFVRVTAHDIHTDEKKLTTESFVTMVALDENGKPTPVRKVHLETEEHRELYETAKQRREMRKQRKTQRKHLSSP